MRRRIKHLHFIGIGGCGMSGIAEILVESGYQVSGSDASLSPVTKRLEKMGIKIFKGHSKHNIKGANVVVYSSAVSQQNPEIICAKEHNVPVIRRAEMLGELMRMKFSIGVSGTHGKTTTTSIVGSILKEGGLDPTIIVGGVTKSIGTGAVKGKGDYLVAEADEFDRSFLKMPSTMAVITTLEVDHLDCYSSLDEIKKAFIEFANRVPFYGCIILCIDEKSIMDIIPQLNKNVVSYGFSAQSDYRIVNREFTEIGSTFVVEHKKKRLGSITLNIPGDYNIKNAMAGVAVGVELGIPFKDIAKSISEFTGVKRRFEIKGEKNKIMVVDDYAHHPTEIKASLKGAKECYKRDIIAVFQPHLYSRTKDFCREFGRSFNNADILIVTDIYPAREKPVKGITGKMISDAAREYGHHKVKYIKDKNRVVDYLLKNIKKNDMVITIGAGDIWEVGEDLLKLI